MLHAVTPKAKLQPLHFAPSRPVSTPGSSAAPAMPDLHLHIHAAPGMNHEQLVEKAKRELRKEMHELMKKHAAKSKPSKSSFDDVDGD